MIKKSNPEIHACKLQKETRSPKEIADIYDLND
jgi:hypothetical protein